MAHDLSGKRVAILVENGFEQSELMEPRKALDQAGATTQVVSPVAGQVRGWKEREWGESVPVDVALERADPHDFDALLLPGGVMSPDKLRTNQRAVAFVEAFFQSRKPVAAICHGPWTIVEAESAKGRTLTSWPSLQTDIRNAGGKWVDQEVAVDNGLVTSRQPADLPAFNARMIDEFAEGEHRAQHAA
ncbi:MAG: type 1 glutamine amidotransferase [Chthonomonadales bacterium]|nr:type 1 glutamine amidotransferase [Chthonomonadales bacterium]